MSTSLAEQLQKLAVPQTSVLKRDKKRPSLLFEPKEAASLRREVFYQIGLDGLEELIEKNEAFEQFRDTLFHLTSRDFERSVHNADANKLLDKNIKKFLLLASPYFLLNSTHKTLEWLINRYMINEYNREDVLMLILPYHESNIFVRVLQLLQFKDQNDSWYFLKALQKPGLHLTKTMLLNHAASNSQFLKFVSKFVQQLIKHHENPGILSVAFNFYCTVFIGAIEYSSEINENQVSQMLPSILNGLSSPITDYCAASYVILARLVAKTTLSDKLLDSFVEKISTLQCTSLKTESTLILVVLYQSQKQYKNVPLEALVNFSEKFNWLPKELSILNNTGSYIYPLLENLVYNSIKYSLYDDIVEVREFVKKLLDEIKIDDGYISSVLNSILDALYTKKYSEEIKNWLSEIVQTLEKQYPTAFDKVVHKILSGVQDDESKKRKKRFQRILANTLTYKGKFEVIENLLHSNEECRTQAVTFLKKNYEKLQETDQHIIKSILLDRLNTDNNKIVKKILSVVQLKKVFNETEMKDILITLLKKCLNGSLNNLSQKILRILLTLEITSDWEVFLAVLPFLLLKTNEDMQLSKEIFLAYVSKQVLLKTAETKLRKSKTCDEFTRVVIKSIKSNSSTDIVKDFLATLKNIPIEKRDCLHKYLSSFVLTSILPKKTSVEICSHILEILLTYYESSPNKNNEKKYSVFQYVEIAAQNAFPLAGFLDIVENIIQKVAKPSESLGKLNFYMDDSNSFFVILSKILFKHKKIYKQSINCFLNYFCENLNEKCEFILNISISENIEMNLTLQEQCLKQILTLVNKSETDEVISLIHINNFIVPYLLVLLYHKEKSIRETVIEILNTLTSSEQKKAESYYCLLEGILKHQEEIILDHEQMPLIILNLLAPENTKGKKNVRELNLIRNTLIKLACNKDHPVYLQSGILQIISLINNIEIFEQVTITALEILKQNSDGLNKFKSEILIKNILRLDQCVSKKIGLDTNVWKLIELTAKDEKTVVNNNGQKTCPAVLILNQLGKEISADFTEQVVEKLLSLVVEVSTFSQNPEILPAASRIFKHIDLDAKHIIEHITNLRDVQSKLLDPKKKRRVNIVPTIDLLDTPEWKKGISVLEFIQDKKKIRNIHILIPVLFDVLKKCLDFDEQAAVEYPKQLILSSILHCCSKLEDESLPENIFNMELVVQCIRASQNPQTHHHALLVLAHTAPIVPTQVLHHIMAIFTFMGSSVLRHEDAYSFQIISKIIDTIIPILVKDDCEKNITKVLRVFVDAILDVPEHRRLPLYKQLLTRINSKENLYLFLLLIFESHVLHNSQEKQNTVNGIDTTPKRLDIAANLCREFSPDIVIYTCIKLITYLKQLPDEKDDYKEDDSDPSIFNIANHTPKQFRHYKYIILTFTTKLLTSKQFVNQVACLNEDETMNLESLYKDSIINILTYVQRISKVAETHAQTPQAQYWKVVLHHSYDILDSINALLTPQMFLLVTKGLMAHKLSTVRRRALELLNSKLQHNSMFFAECDKKEIYVLVPWLHSIIETLDSDKVDQDQELIIQTALLTLKLLTKQMASEDPENFVQILDFITVLLKSGKAQNNVQASVVLCLAELCSNLRAHALSNLPIFMPALLKILKQQKNIDSPSLLLLSAITAIHKILESLPLFLSPYIEKLLFELSVLSSKWDTSAEDQKLQPFINKLSNIKQKIGSVIPLRVLIPSIEQCYNLLLEKKCFNAISSVMDILAESLKNLKGPEINSNLQELTAFFLNALQFRETCSCNLEEGNEIESHIIKSFTLLILKLSEGTFRPLYYKLFDWATRNELKTERVITFYGLSSGIAESLKGLFVLFAGHFLNNAAQILDSCNKIKNETLYFEDDRKNILLTENVLKTLHSVFLHDSQKFVNKDRFEVLMQPLVDQLENTLGGIDSLVDRNERILTPCLVQFATATGDDFLWKQMNYQILLKMRHTTPAIRLVALHCLTEIVKKLGEEFLPLLPETIPFLAELLEDEEEGVEKSCQKAVQEMEKVLGEPLQKYF